MSNNKWLRSFVIGTVLPISVFIAHNVFAQSSPATCGNGLLETGEECDLGTKNGQNLGCNGCTIQNGWTCNTDGVGYMNMITDKSNPNSLASLYTTLTSSSTAAPYSSTAASTKCTTLSNQDTIDACRQYVKNVALFKQLNAQFSIETAAGGSVTPACTVNSPEIKDVDTKSFTMLTTPVTVNCTPDTTKGIR